MPHHSILTVSDIEFLFLTAFLQIYVVNRSNVGRLKSFRLKYTNMYYPERILYTYSVDF